MTYYTVFMLRDKESGSPYPNHVFCELVEARTEEEAFLKWLDINRFDFNDYSKINNHIWSNYHYVYVLEVK